MKNKIVNTFAIIGVITVVVLACSSALSEDDDVIIPNNTTGVAVETTNPVSTTTNTGSTNTSSTETTNTTTNTETTSESTSTDATTNSAVQQNEIGRYQITVQDGLFNAVFILDTKSGSIMYRERLNWQFDNIWYPLPVTEESDGEIGRYQIAGILGNKSTVYIVDTKTGDVMLRYQDNWQNIENVWIALPVS